MRRATPFGARTRSILVRQTESTVRSLTSARRRRFSPGECKTSITRLPARSAKRGWPVVLFCLERVADAFARVPRWDSARRRRSWSRALIGENLWRNGAKRVPRRDTKEFPFLEFRGAYAAKKKGLMGNAISNLRQIGLALTKYALEHQPRRVGLGCALRNNRAPRHSG
jgi:hypothetical protein